MKINKLYINDNTTLCADVTNPDGSSTIVMWDVAAFLTGQNSVLNFAVVEPNGQLDVNSVIEVPVPGFGASDDVLDAYRESMEARLNGSLN